VISSEGSALPILYAAFYKISIGILMRKIALQYDKQNFVIIIVRIMPKIGTSYKNRSVQPRQLKSSRQV